MGFYSVQRFWKAIICLINTKITVHTLELGSDSKVFETPAQAKSDIFSRSKSTKQISQNQIFHPEKHTMGNLRLYTVNFMACIFTPRSHEWSRVKHHNDLQQLQVCTPFQKWFKQSHLNFRSGEQVSHNQFGVTLLYYI